MRNLVGVGMVATEDRAVWFGGCRRPRLGGRRVRHPFDLGGPRGGGGSGRLRITGGKQALQREY
jgi:hypothetical protein